MLSPDTIRRVIDSRLPGTAEIRRNEPMAAHTTFQVGGPADYWVRPGGEDFPAVAAALLGAARSEGVPVFILGGGANIVVSDAGIRGIVLDTSSWTGETAKTETAALSLRSGTSLDAAAELAADGGLSGLEFLAGMPGSIGGAVWMNARCYEREIAGVLAETVIIDCYAKGPYPALQGVIKGMDPETYTLPKQHTPSLQGGVVDFSGTRAAAPLRVPVDRAAFGYKRSPFQGRSCLILEAGFALRPGKPGEIRRTMETHRRDREAKGHYRCPSAGSAFKNSRDFGKATGMIIDELGLRGLRIGGAQVAPYHGNIIINAGGATAADIRALVDEVARRVKDAAGLTLEPEILFVGDWSGRNSVRKQ